MKELEHLFSKKIADERALVYSECECIMASIMQNIPTAPSNDFGDTICIDLETTGLDKSKSEILQIAIIDGNGNELLNTYVKPYFAKTWSDAEKINGISPEMVQNAPYLHDIIGKIRGLIENCKIIVGYNHKGYDLVILERYGLSFDGKILSDVMLDFAPIYGEWSEERNAYKWKKLIDCAEYFGYDWGSDQAHDGLADTRATLYCYKKIKALD